MDKLLALLKSLNFLKAICYVVEMVILQLAPQYALQAGVLLLAVVAILNLFGVQPELRFKAELKAISDYRASMKPAKTSKK
jgi:hypothetical protein